MAGGEQQFAQGGTLTVGAVGPTGEPDEEPAVGVVLPVLLHPVVDQRGPPRSGCPAHDRDLGPDAVGEPGVQLPERPLVVGVVLRHGRDLAQRRHPPRTVEVDLPDVAPHDDSFSGPIEQVLHTRTVPPPTAPTRTKKASTTGPDKPELRKKQASWLVNTKRPNAHNRKEHAPWGSGGSPPRV